MLHNELTRYSLEKDFGSASPPMDVDLEANFVADGQADGDDSMSDQVWQWPIYGDRSWYSVDRSSIASCVEMEVIWFSAASACVLSALAPTYSA